MKTLADAFDSLHNGPMPSFRRDRPVLLCLASLLAGCSFAPHLQQAFFPTYPDHPIAPSTTIVFKRDEGHSRSVEFTPAKPLGDMNGKGPACLTRIAWNGYPAEPPLDIGQTMHLEVPHPGRHLLVAKSHSGNCSNFQASRYVITTKPYEPVSVTIVQH